MSDWWLSRASGAPEGPFPTQALVQGLNLGQIPNQAYVCRVGEQRWVRISQVDEIWNVVHPEQDRTQVTERPWFQKTTEIQAMLVHEANGLCDADDENERTQIISPTQAALPDGPSRAVTTPLPGQNALTRAVPTPVPHLPAPPQGSPSRTVFTPLPHLPAPPQGSPTRAVLTPLPHLPVPPQGSSSRAVLTPLPNLPVPPDGPSRAIPTPLPHHPLPFIRVAVPSTVPEPIEELPIRAKIPTLEGIQDPTRSALAVSEPKPNISGIPQSPLGRSTASTTSTHLTETPDATSINRRQSPVADERSIAVAPTSPPSPTLSGNIPDAKVSATHQSALKGLAGLGLSPLPKAAGGPTLVRGFSALPLATKTSPVSSPSESNSTEPVPSIEPTSGMTVAIRSGSALQRKTELSTGISALPPILGVTNSSQLASGTNISSPGTAPVMQPPRHVEPNAAAVPPLAPLLDDTDAEEVTTIAKPDQLPLEAHLRNAFDEDVTTIVSADKLPASDARHPVDRAEPVPLPLLTNVEVVPVKASLPTPDNQTDNVRLVARPPATAVQVAVIAPSRNLQPNTRVPLPVPSAPHTAAPLPAPSAPRAAAPLPAPSAPHTTAPLPAPSAPRASVEHDASTNLSTHVEGRGKPAYPEFPHELEPSADLVADPSELLEEDTDDSSMPIHMVSSGPHPSTVPMRRDNAAESPSVSSANQPTGPVISVPPKATHQAAAPSVVLRPEPVVHQEATKPAVRALRPPGVVQVTYGTIVIAILGVALLVLLLVLLLK